MTSVEFGVEPKEMPELTWVCEMERRVEQVTKAHELAEWLYWLERE